MSTTIERAYVTGASSGIGRELCLRLVERGCEVVAIARREERLRELAEACRGRTGTLHVETLDVADTDAARASVFAWDDRLGGAEGRGLDLVVANAGVGLGEHAARLPWTDVRRTFEVNVLGATAVLVAGLERMAPRERGTLVGISSLAGTGGMPSSGAYSASKAALSVFLETLAIDLRGSAVRVVDVQPGYVVSEMTADAEHPLPFLWPTDRAVRRILRGIERGAPRVRFPLGVALPLALLDAAPRPVWRAVMALAGRASRRDRG
ncbi:MAG: SDR family NAD(P)-dependent oxidoreductase [Planctomycetota bacterium]